jgi:hypothetical protein
MTSTVIAFVHAVSDGRKPPRSSVFREEPPPEMCVYRGRTISLLRRYCRWALELGRLPSLVGREVFRGRSSSYQVHTFEDRVIFAYDVERCLDLLDERARQLIACVVLQEYSYDEAARLLHCSRLTVCRRFPEAIDRLTQVLLERKLLRPYGAEATAEACQEPQTGTLPPSS